MNVYQRTKSKFFVIQPAGFAEKSFSLTLGNCHTEIVIPRPQVDSIKVSCYKGCISIRTKNLAKSGLQQRTNFFSPSSFQAVPDLSICSFFLVGNHGKGNSSVLEFIMSTLCSCQKKGYIFFLFMILQSLFTGQS